MQIDVLEMKETRAKLLIYDADPFLVNALRRTLISDIPKMAIEEVDFHLGPIGASDDGRVADGSSPLFDEIIAHRLGLIPIPTDLKLFRFRSECEHPPEESCPLCTLTYVLHKVGPCTVYSGDMEPISGTEYRPKDELIPIVELSDGQAVYITANAVLGTGKEHAKWQVTSGVGYKYYPSIYLDDSKCTDCKKCMEVCPKKVFEEVDGKVVVKNPENCSLCNACVEACPEAVKVEGDPTKFIFSFETDGSLTAEETLKYALKHLSERFEELRENVSELK